jgi:hypothetical protein
MLSQERDPPMKDKTLPFNKTSKNGLETPTSPKITLLKVIELSTLAKHQTKNLISMLLLRFFKFLNLMSTPTNLRLETTVEKLSTLLLLSLNSHTSDKDPLLESDQLLMTPPLKLKMF